MQAIKNWIAWNACNWIANLRVPTNSEIDINEIGFYEITICEIGFFEIAICEIGFFEIDICEIGF